MKLPISSSTMTKAKQEPRQLCSLPTSNSGHQCRKADTFLSAGQQTDTKPDKISGMEHALE